MHGESGNKIPAGAMEAKMETAQQHEAKLLRDAPSRFIGFEFGWALNRLEAGGFVMRAGWNGRGQVLALQRPDPHSKMSLPYIFITTVQGQKVPWVASQTDLLAKDWVGA